MTCKWHPHPQACACMWVPMEAIRGHYILWNWSYRRLSTTWYGYWEPNWSPCKSSLNSWMLVAYMKHQLYEQMLSQYISFIPTKAGQRWYWNKVKLLCDSLILELWSSDTSRRSWPLIISDGRNDSEFHGTWVHELFENFRICLLSFALLSCNSLSHPAIYLWV